MDRPLPRVASRGPTPQLAHDPPAPGTDLTPFSAPRLAGAFRPSPRRGNLGSRPAVGELDSANAIQDATGLRITELPMTPERMALAVLEAGAKA